MIRSRGAGRWRGIGLVFVAVAIFGVAITVWLRTREVTGPAILSTVTPWPDREQAGLSGLVISGDGRMLTVLSDQNYIVTADLDRGPTGGLQAIVSGDVIALSPPPAADWPDSWLYTDSEGLARLPDGRLAVAYEALHRVSIFDDRGLHVEWIDVPGLFDHLAVNTGIEAVTATADGVILAIPEAWDVDTQGLPLFSVTPPVDSWEIAARLRSTPGFAPVDLDIDGAGRLYLLERRLYWWGGFSSRIRRFRLEQGQITDEEVLLHTPPGRHGNLEGLAIWTRPDGGHQATLVSDNNGWIFLRQQIVEYRLSEDAGR